ncbi:SAV0927 family protein [Virgibacillus byunsanensis]|uniref:SAV0927 family protein n=1 Tax=Virgibacillus byunsanensis TaxID=570945 RepID=A0ABW3LN47_9BACI
MSSEQDYILDKTVKKEVRYISFMGNLHRHDFALMEHREDPSKKVVIDLQRNRFAILGRDDIAKEGGIEHIFHVTEMEAEELREFFKQIL